MIYASVFDIKSLFGKTDALYRTLSPTEKKRADERKNPQDRDRFICARALLSMLYVYSEQQKRVCRKKFDKKSITRKTDDVIGIQAGGDTGFENAIAQADEGAGFENAIGTQADDDISLEKTTASSVEARAAAICSLENHVVKTVQFSDKRRDAVTLLTFDTLFALPMPQIIALDKEKPCFAGEDVHFSISHAENVVFAAIGDLPVGADIELADKEKKTVRIAERFFTDGERRTDFFTAWTRKEAYAKLTGAGFCGTLGIDTSACGAKFLSFPYKDGCDGDYMATIAHF